MGQIPLLKEIALVAGMGVLVAVIVARVRLPTVAGLLLAGAIVGPHGLRLVADVHAIEVIAEVGVVLLLFTIGLEFSLARMSHIFRTVALGGLLQVGGTLLAVALSARAFGASWPASLVFGFVFALSSTAIVLKALTERHELDAPHGRFIVGALIFQDLCVVPMVLLVPLLGESGGTQVTTAIALAMGKAALVVVGVLGLSRLIVPRVLDWVEASRSREMFLLAVLALCVGTAWLTSLAGLSLALGAFLGGMVVADTEHSHRAMGDMLPLRDVFMSFFFVSIGMFFDVHVLVQRPLLVALLLFGFMVGKGAIATAAALTMRFPARAAWLAGVGLAQFGEFGFVLVRLATDSGLVDSHQVDPLLNAGILSMFFTPLMLQRAPHITAGERLLAPLAKLLQANGIEEGDVSGKTLRDHVVLIGYGVAGRLLTTALRALNVEMRVLELNAENVRRGRALGDPVFYADATSPEALGHAHVETARCVVVAINDLPSTFRVVDALSRVAPQTPVLSRTRFLSDQGPLHAVGAQHVVSDEVEGGVEVLARVLRELDVPRNVIEGQIRIARENTVSSARSMTLPRKRLSDASPLSGLKIESVLVVEGSAGASRSPRELELRVQTGALLVAVHRAQELLPHPSPAEPLRVGDVAYLIGTSQAVRAAVRLLGEPVPAAPQVPG